MTNNHEGSAEEFLNLMDRLRQIGPQTAPPKEANISPSHLAYLTFLESHPGCGIQALAAGLKLSKATVSISVAQLEEAGFLTRKPDPKDGRAIQLFLTSKGQDIHKRTYGFRCQKFENLLKYLTPQERVTLINLFGKAIRSIENEALGEMK